jgi:hypothetical protein
MSHIRLLILGFCVSTSCLIANIGIDPCIYSQEGVYTIKDHLEQSGHKTTTSVAWKNKCVKRNMQKVLRFFCYVALPALCAVAVVASEKDRRDFAGFFVFAALVGCRFAYKSIKAIGETGDKQDVCEIEMQRMIDLKKGGYLEQANEILKFLSLRRQAPDASGEDLGRYYAAKIGLNVPSTITESERERLACGPLHYWERCDHA